MGQAHDDGVRSVDIRVSPAPVSPELFDECERDVLVMYCHVCPAVPLWSSPGEWSRHTRLSGPQSASDDIQLSVTRSDVTPSPQISFLDNNIYIDSKIIHNVRSRNPVVYTYTKNPRGQSPSMIEDCSIISVLIVFFVCHDCNVQTNQQNSEVIQHCNIVAFDMSVTHLCHHWELIEDKT